MCGRDVNSKNMLQKATQLYQSGYKSKNSQVKYGSLVYLDTELRFERVRKKAHNNRVNNNGWRIERQKRRC